LLVVLDAQQAQLTHARPDPARHASRRLPLLDVRSDLLLDEGPHGPAKHLVLLVEDLHARVTLSPDRTAQATRARREPERCGTFRARALPAQSCSGGRQDEKSEPHGSLFFVRRKGGEAPLRGHCPTMSPFIGPSAPISSCFSLAPTLFLSRALPRFSTVALH